MPKLKLDSVKPNVSFPELEELVLDYWDEVDAFKRSMEERPENNPYVFYDGPPFATGMPHYGHLLGSVMKDIVPRYWTMKGYRVERVWGWDCHGIPIENMIEKKLELKGGKKGIEEMGIDKFNAACRSEVLVLDKEWEKIIRRIGRWVDFKHNYKTMDLKFMESVWWAFKSLYDKDLVYEGKRVILYCPRCATPLSNFEIAMDNSYKDHVSPSTTYKYKVKGQDNTFLLAWSTTPWNKLATPALAVNPNLTYVKVKQGDEFYILAQSRLEETLKSNVYQTIEKYTGKDLEQFEFELHYDFYPDRGDKKAGVVVADDYVTDDEGTGIVTLAVYGEDDYRVMTARNIQLVEHVDSQGLLKPEVTPWAGMFVHKVNPLVNEDLQKRGLIYHNEDRVHSVPVCYRCETRLYHAPVPAWFINIQKIKPTMIETNEAINWFPKHLKHGRFGKGLETAPDWNISRSRYWGTPMPVWVGEKTGKIRIIGSIEELTAWAVNPELAKRLTDIHREFIDPIEVWVDDAKTEKGKRIPEVFDCWVESGSMPYASEHYPFENEARFEARHPAQFISEYIAQTRAWFYTLHVMSVGLFGKHTFENALTTGTIMAADGTKMSKSKRNFTDPMLLVDKYGVDSLRLYFASSPIMKTAENINFNETSVDELKKKVFNIFWNVFSFYSMYDNGETTYGFPENLDHVMDAWLASITQRLNQGVLKAMDAYDVVGASRLLIDYVNDLSTWYLRQSRDRLRNKQPQSLQVLRTALMEWAKLMAPFAPFFTEVLYQNLPGDKKSSIHLELLASLPASLRNVDLETAMAEIQKVAGEAHAQRKDKAIKVRQPLARLTVTSSVASPTPNLLAVLADEVNVKEVLWHQGNEARIELDTTLTPELKAEGEARELIRAIQDARKKMGTRIDEQVIVELPGWPESLTEDIKAKVLAKELVRGETIVVRRLE